MDLCSRLLKSIEAPLGRRDWLEFMVGVAAVCVMTGRGEAMCGIEAFGFRRPLGVSIIAWIFSSTFTNTTQTCSIERGLTWSNNT